MEDKSSDAELVKLQLEDLGLRCEYKVTDKKEIYVQLLQEYSPDLIISDFNLPRFDGLKALAILRAQDDLTPFIFVTGTMGEENAVEAIRSGATDFIVKERIEQLPSAIVRALREKVERQSKKEISNKLWKSEQNYKSLFHLSPLPMWVYDLRTYKFLKVNEAAVGHYGYSHEEFQMLSIRDIRPAEDIPFVEETRRLTMGKDELFEGVFRHKKKNGDIIYVELQSRYIEQDGVKARLVVANDITKRKKLEKEREAILESITDGFFAVDRDWTVTYWNKAAEAILQIPKENILNKNLWEIFESHLKLKFYEEYYHALKNQEVRVFETHYQSLGLWTETSIFPKGDGLTVYLKDVSERKQHQYQIFKTIQETQETERARFGRDMHDGLTQSLTAIKMNLSHFKDRLMKGETRMETLERAMVYLNNSIKESRTISHGLLSVTLESYGLITALEEAVDNINKNNKVHVTFNHNFPAKRLLSKELEINIYRIVQEALTNILKHSRATEAEIVLLKGTESVQLVINDNGIGIKALTDGENPPGAGLKNIKVRVEGFDGKLTLVNMEDKGFQINVVFPKPDLAEDES